MRSSIVPPVHTRRGTSESIRGPRTGPLLVEYPLLGHRDPESAVAIRSGRRISAAEFLAAAWSLLARLPKRPYVVNLCEDRYQFAVGLAAALLARQVSLLPTCRAPESLRRLTDQYPEAYLLTDRQNPDAPLPQMCLPAPAPASWQCDNIPWFPASQTAVIVFTSGSTGVPQAHPKSWGSLVQGARAFTRQFDLPGHSRRIVVGTVPPQHMYGLESTVMLPLQLGWAFHAHRPALPDDLRRDCAELTDPTWLMTTPVHLRTLEGQSAAPPALEGIVSATMPLNPALAGSLERRWDIPIYEVYGCTEGGMLAGRRPSKARRWTLCADLMIEQDERSTRITGGHVGKTIELADRITIHSEREFSLHGRGADLVKIAGKRTSLAALNLVLARIPGVRDGMFFQTPLSTSGTARVSAAVVAPGMTKRAILKELRRHIDPVFLPRPLHLVEALPRNETGKVPYAHLVACATAASSRRSAHAHE